MLGNMREKMRQQFIQNNLPAWIDAQALLAQNYYQGNMAKPPPPAQAPQQGAGFLGGVRALMQPNKNQVTYQNGRFGGMPQGREGIQSIGQTEKPFMTWLMLQGMNSGRF